MSRSSTLPRALVVAGGLAAVALLAILALFLAVEKREAAAAPDFRVAQTGGMEYQSMSGRPIRPGNAVDRKIIAGLPARQRRLRHGEMLFGAFIAFNNASAHPLRSADRIELRTDGGRVYKALRLPPTNPYAYSPRSIRPGTRIPAQGTPADDNLAATGRLVLFRIDARTYTDGGTLELVIHQAGQPPTSLII